MTVRAADLRGPAHPAPALRVHPGHLHRFRGRRAVFVVGTFALVFAATGSIMVNELTGGPVTHIGVAAAPGLVVAAMIYAVGDISPPSGGGAGESGSPAPSAAPP